MNMHSILKANLNNEVIVFYGKREIKGLVNFDREVVCFYLTRLLNGGDTEEKTYLNLDRIDFIRIEEPFLM